MIDAGLSVTKVAKKLSVKRDTVKAAEAVGKSGAAMDALGTGQLSLEEAAAISEFDDDPDAVNTLIEVAGTHRFEHRIQQLRHARESQRAYDAAVAGVHRARLPGDRGEPGVGRHVVRRARPSAHRRR